MNPELPPSNNVMTKQMHIGGKPMAGGMFLKAIIVFILLAVVIIATGVIGFEVGKLYQKNESKDLVPTVNSNDSDDAGGTRPEGEGYTDDNDTDTPQNDSTGMTDADLGLKWERESYTGEGGVVWNFEHPTTSWSTERVGTGGVTNQLGFSQVVDGVKYILIFDYPTFSGSGEPATLEEFAEMYNVQDTSAEGIQKLKVDGVDVLLVPSSVAGGSRAFIWKKGTRKPSSIVLFMDGGDASNETGDILLERIVRSLEF